MSRAVLLNANLTALFDIIRPIGSLYSTVDSTFNPNSASGWHGTWERIKDCMIYASGDSDTVGEIVGSNSHALNLYELPRHTHTIPQLSGTTNEAGAHTHKVFGDGQGTPYGWDWSGSLGQLSSSSSGSAYWNLSTGSGGKHKHTVTTDASTTGSEGYYTPIDLRSRRINAIVWKRIA